MRKEVKLGMGLGGGLVALLVAYLIVAPPSDKHGTQLVTGEGGSIIDPPNGAAGGDGAAAPLAEDKGGAPAAAVASEPVKAEAPAAHPVELPKAAETKTAVAKVAEKASGAAAGRDPWKVLDDPKSAKAQPAKLAGNPSAPSPAPAKEKEGREPVKVAEHKAAPAAEKREIKLASSETGVAPEARSDARLYYTNPNDAWGGGLSTDAAAAAVERSMKGAGVPKAGPVAGTPPTRPEEGTSAELGSTSAAPKAGATHVVRSGETFSSIAQAVYGSAAYYPHLIRANPHANPNNLKLGTVITIPKVEDVKATGGPVSSAGEHSKGAALTVVDDVKIDPAKQYRVQSGDSLYKISQKVYGKPTYVEAIYEKNRQQIGANPTRLKLGMILDLPEKTAGGQPEAALGGGTSGEAR